MRIAIATIFMSALFCGCSTIDQNTAIDPSGKDAFALVVADNLVQRVAGSYTFIFNKADLERSTFTADSFAIVFDAGAGTFVVDELEKPSSTISDLRFGGKLVRAGDYAYTARIELVGNIRTVKCFADGAPVYRISSGRTNIISLGGVRGPGITSPDVALAQSAIVLAGYPKLSAPLESAENVASIKFKTGRALGVEVCLKREVTPFIITAQSAEP